jgi:rubredoxin
MVSTTTRNEMTWYECEHCGLLFDAQEDARQHEQNCNAEGPSYIQ